MEYKDLSKEEKLMYAQQLAKNPVFNHIMDKLQDSAFNKLIATTAATLPHEKESLLNAIKATRDVKNMVNAEVNRIIDSPLKRM